MRPILAALFLGILIAGATPTPVAAASCAQAIASTFPKLVQAHLRSMQRCRDRVLTGRASGPCPDSRTATQLAKARTKLRQVVNQRCGGPDGTCGAGGDDVALAEVGWNVAQCPNVHGGHCTQAIGHCGDVADCLVCVGETAVDAALALVYDALAPSQPDDELNRCQATIGRSLARYLDAQSDTLAVCERRALTAETPGVCPDPVRGVPRLAREEETLVNRICDACGASDDVCGGDDLPPEWIGFPATCPDVTPPGRASCAHPIAQLADLVECVRCVTDFYAGCLDPLAVPTLRAYPGECP